ncbi:MAG: hypothetical protein VX583_03155 [Bdellovibrionota bacterium]
MHKEFDIYQTKVFDLMRVEMDILRKMEKAFIEQGVSIESVLIDEILRFAKAFLLFEHSIRMGSKRERENNIKFRVGTIRRVHKQSKLSDTVVDDFLESDYLNRLLQIAIIEKASLIFDRAKGRDARDTSEIDFALSKIVWALKLLKVDKPVEVLAVALEKSKILEETTSTNLSYRSLQNRLSKLKHPKNIKMKNLTSPPISLAAEYLKSELPELKRLVEQQLHEIIKTDESNLYAIVPYSSKHIFPQLFSKN